MDVLMVVESMFGNTRHIGEEVAKGLADAGASVRLVSVADAPAAIDEFFGLVVIGAPTHNRGLSTPATRAQASKEGAPALAKGVREWLGSEAFPTTATVAVFDTCTSRSWLSGSAAKAAVKALARVGVAAVAQTFLVRGAQGPLQPGQLEAARTWGRGLAS